jgi:hypothetical protein
MADLGLQESLIVITGARGVGKSTAAATYLPPSRVGEVFYHDGEHSTNRIVEQLARRNLAFGYLSHLDGRWTKDMPADADLLDRISKGKLPWATTKEKNTLIDFYKYIVDDIKNNLTPGKFSVYVHDPVERLEAAMAAWVDEYKDAAGWSSRAFGRNWTEGFYPLYRGLMEAIYARGVKVIIFTAHLGSPWLEGGKGIIPGKVKPRAKPELFKMAQLYVWLVEEPRNADGAPAGIILKERLGELKSTATDSWDIRSGLPHRVPHFTWDDVARYVNEGFDQANPAPGETLTMQEAQMIDETFYSNEQMKLMLTWAKTDLAEIAAANPSLLSMGGEVEPDVSPETLARALAASGSLTAAQIAEQLGKPLVLVNKWVGGA